MPWTPWTGPLFTGGVTWRDLPDTTTPLDAANLNTEDNAEATYAAQVGQSVFNSITGQLPDPQAGVIYAAAHGADTAGDATAVLHAIRDAAPVGSEIRLTPGFTYNVTSLVGNKALTWNARGAIIRQSNGANSGSNTHLFTQTVAGGRILGGEWDGNRTTQAGTGWGVVCISTSDFEVEDVYIHSTVGPCLGNYDSNNVRFIRPLCNDSAPSSHTIYATSVTANRSVFRVVDAIVDRSSESPSGFTSRGIKIDRTAFTFSDIKVSGVVKLPAINNSGVICTEIWGGCQGVKLDVETSGGGVGVSLDAVDGCTGNVISRGALQEGLEIATSAKHVFLTGVLDGQGVGGAGISVSNTACEETVLDFQIDNMGVTGARCAKIQNSNGFSLRGEWRHRISGENALEMISCTDWHLDLSLDGRNDGGTASAQDALDLDGSSNGTGFLRAAHFTRCAVGFYRFAAGTVDNISIWGAINDCSANPVQSFGFSGGGVLGSNVRFHLDGDQTPGTVVSASTPSGTGLWHTDLFSVSGTTGITALPAGPTQKGRQITLIFQGVLTVTSGNNLKLSGNFTTATNSTLTLISDGTNWYEVSRKS